ncbi:hypothetical protein [Leptospira jelokensis]|uniref:hypothetical protein n=1 Tax=Leptospira jelokensis TaxID=2484931 RepID=UPI001090BBA7|nr:hypothetical protein [Leptospira jelokensis]TGL99966.1 hypothetical protein EHQ79_14980 [Leptospira jelokensis]
MIYINAQKIKNYELDSFFHDLYGTRMKNLDYINVEDLGTLIKNYVSISKKKILSINPRINNPDKIPATFTPEELVMRITDKQLDKMDFDDYIVNHQIKSILIENSNINEIKINQNITTEGSINLEINNSKIDHVYINLFKKINPNHTFRIKHTFTELKTVFIFLESENQSLTNIENINTTILKLNVESVKISACSFAFPIILNKSKTKIDIKDCELVFSNKSNSILQNLIKNKGKENITYSQILSALRYLNSLNDSEYFIRNLEKIYAYIDSKRSLTTKILYHYTEYYYNFTRPFLGMTACFLIFQAICQYTNLSNSNLEISYIFRPLDFTKDILFKDFKFSGSLKNFSIAKFCLSVISITFYYSSFSFFLAIKKNFGYRKIN